MSDAVGVDSCEKEHQLPGKSPVSVYIVCVGNGRMFKIQGACVYLQ